MAEQRMGFEDAVAQLDVYRRQIELTARNVELLQSLHAQAAQARATLDAWQHRSGGDEVLVPLGANSFVKARLEDPTTVLLGVGRDYSAERPTSEAVSWLERRETELAQELDRMGQALFRLRQDAAALQEALEEAAEAAQGAPAPS